MEPVAEFCLRVVSPAAAAEAVQRARQSPSESLTERLTAAGAACRALTGGEGTSGTRAGGDRARLDHAGEDRAEGPGRDPEPAADQSLSGNVARELQAVVLALPERQREALALRDGIGLDYGDMATVMGVGRPAIGPLLARARLRFRAERRGVPAPATETCPEWPKAALLAGHRIDQEPMSEGDLVWLEAHVGGCITCGQGQVAMLEASACLQAWPVAELAGARAEVFRPTTGSEPEPRPGWMARLRRTIVEDTRR